MQQITTTDELAALCARCARGPYVTVDTEFMRERTFWSQLCLVQLAAPAADGEPEVAAIVDPQANGLALDPLFELLADERVVKVFHAARQDVEIFHHLGRVIPRPMFDSQVAAMVLGFGEQVGYETLVRRVAKAELDKSSRFTDWSRRPLSEKQLAYALGDVTHLRTIYESLSHRLDRSGRAHWVAEEMAILTDPETYITRPEDAWKRIKARSNSPAFLAIVAALAAWREREAQTRDVPRQRLMKDDALLEIAVARPRSPEDLGKLRLIQREARKPDFAAGIIAAVAEGMSCPPDQRPTLPPPPRRREGSAAVADLLRVFLKARADALGIAAKLIASTSDLDALAGEDDPDLPLLRGWRREVFGEDALRLVAGELGLVARPGGVEVFEFG
ncbi:ribonuclease D [Limibaculum sp. M0105]|uniref:Ribonuclease D n=1 Tax=Thermohalobaculum xanthum TaxID=2753746 RepID=A0A8J7M4P0_9RHOB|nr:ribonuclease D [Thermohalobaculum xanthum]MBK0397567.1 ribonuclease D [Thermohalobaculum xanthum]